MAVSAHVFHWFFSWFLVPCVYTFFFGFMSQSGVVDASGTPVLNSPLQLSSSNFGSLNGSGSDLDGMGTRSGSTTDEKLDALLSKIVHFEAQIAQIPTLTTWMSRMDSHFTKTLGILRLDLQRWNRTSALSLHVCARSRHLRPQHQMYPVRHDPGFQVNRLTAPQPQGPMAQDHLTTKGRRDAYLTFPQALLMNMREVPSYYDSHVNSTMLEVRSGSIFFGKSPTYLPTINLLRFIARQGPCRSDLYSETRGKRQHLNARYEDDGIPYSINRPFCCTNTNVIVRQCRSIEDREIGK